MFCDPTDRRESYIQVPREWKEASPAASNVPCRAEPPYRGCLFGMVARTTQVNLAHKFGETSDDVEAESR